MTDQIQTYVIIHPRGGRAKIGKTINVKKRMADLSRSGGFEFHPAVLIPGDREGELHRRFARHRVLGEWFSLSEDFAEWLHSECGVDLGPFAALPPVRQPPVRLAIERALKGPLRQTGLDALEEYLRDVLEAHIERTIPEWVAEEDGLDDGWRAHENMDDAERELHRDYVESVAGAGSCYYCEFLDGPLDVSLKIIHPLEDFSDLFIGWSGGRYSASCIYHHFAVVFRRPAVAAERKSLHEALIRAAEDTDDCETALDVLAISAYVVDDDGRVSRLEVYDQLYPRPRVERQPGLFPKSET